MKKNRIYRTNNQEYITIYSKQYFQKNKKENIDKRKQRRHTIPYVKICHNMRSLTNRAFKRQNVLKDYKTMNLIGCSHSFFKNWISYQLYGNMSMENYGKVWQIDHCLPINSFNLLNENEVKKCFHWSNLRPMYSNENSLKNDKVDQRLYLLQEIKANYFLKFHMT